MVFASFVYKNFPFECPWFFFTLIWGKKSKLVICFTNKLPVLEKLTTSEIIATNLHAMHNTRKAFLHSESFEKLRRGLLHNYASTIIPIFLMEI